MITDLTKPNRLDSRLHDLDEQIAEATTAAEFRDLEGSALDLAGEWRIHFHGLIDALAAHRLVDARYRACAGMVRLRVELAAAVQYAEARALEASDRVEVCRHHRELKERSPMERAYQNFLAEEAP